MSMEHILTVRLEEKDMEKLRRDALLTDRTLSDHIRLLIRTPVELSEGEGSCLVFSLGELAKIERQLQRMGINFNQCVRSLNSLVLFADAGGDISDHYAKTLNFVSGDIQSLQVALVETMEVFLRLEKRAWILENPHCRLQKSLVERSLDSVKKTGLWKID